MTWGGLFAAAQAGKQHSVDGLWDREEELEAETLQFGVDQATNVTEANIATVGALSLEGSKQLMLENTN